MDDPSVTDRIITEMKQYKMQGRTYAQVKELLKEVGYTDEQLAEAEVQFDYDAPIAYDKNGNPIDNAHRTRKLVKMPAPVPPKPEVKPEPVPAPVKAPPKAANPPRPHKPLNLRPVTYVVVATLAGFVGAQFYRLWLHLQYLSSVYNPKYLLSHNMFFYYLWGGIGVGVAIFVLKLYFKWIDKQQ